ncbi:MAG: NnrU family protein [Alphaproteobacteria bacterium]
MIHFAVAVVCFLLLHSLPARPAWRARLVSAVGERTYLVAYSVLSVVLLVWVIRAALAAPYVALWPPAAWQAWVAMMGTAPAFAVLGAAALQPNPLSAAFVTGDFDPDRPGIVGLLRHPVLFGAGLWALAHLPANGDVVSVVLFGGLALFAAGGTFLLDRRHRRRLGENAWHDLDQARRGVRPDARMIVGAMAGLAAWFAMVLGLHEWLFGVGPLTYL